jgi:hypothetical protein
MGCHGVCGNDGIFLVITSKSIVDEISKIGYELSKLNVEDNSNFKLNLGLSNLGIEYSQVKFQDLYSKLLFELNEVFEEYSKNPGRSHWDLGAVLTPVKVAVELVIEVAQKLSEAPYLVLESDQYQKRFKEALLPFVRLPGVNYLDPLRISLLHGRDYSLYVHGDSGEIPDKSSSALVRINQFLNLLEAIIDSIEFRIANLEEDRKEILEDLEAANRVGSLKTVYGVSYSEDTYGKHGPWSTRNLPLDTYLQKLKYEYEAIEVLYLGMSTEESTWEDLLFHLHGTFDSDFVADVRHYFEGSKNIWMYEGLNSGLDELYTLEREYSSWYSNFKEISS